MFKIGDFSKLTQVSAKMLRHYDEIGLLKPARVDGESGYRYYSASQLPRLNRIIVLKHLGFSLQQIAHLLDDGLPPEELRGMLKLRQAEVESRLRAEQERLAMIGARLRHLEKVHGQPRYEVLVRSIEPRLMATLRQRVSSMGQPITDLFEAVEDYIRPYNVRSFDSPLMIFHDDDYRETDLDVEVAVPLDASCPASENIQVRAVEGIAQAACAVYTGEYAKTPDVLNSMTLWIEANGYTITGAMREVYLRFGADTRFRLPKAFLAHNAKAFVTELQIPVEKEQQ